MRSGNRYRRLMSQAQVGTPSWVAVSANLAPAVFVLDAENSRGYYKRQVMTEPVLLSQTVSEKSGATYKFGPYEASDAAEVLTNSGFDVDVSSWPNVSNGSVAWDATGRARYTHLGTGFSAISQALTSPTGRAFRVRMRARRDTATAGMTATLSNTNSGLTGGLVLSSSASGTSDSDVSIIAASGAAAWIGARKTNTGGTGDYLIDSISAKEVSPFDGWNASSGYAFVVEFTTPGSAPGTSQVIYEAHDDSTGSGLNGQRVTLATDLSLTVNGYVANSSFVTLAMGTLSTSTRYRLAVNIVPGTGAYGSINGAIPVTGTANSVSGAGYLSLNKDRAGASTFGGTLHSVHVFANAQTTEWVAAASDLSGALIWTEGDSFMAGAGGVSLSASVRTAASRVVVNTAIGGSTLASVLSRMQARPYLRGRTLIIWDGSSNGYTSVAYTSGLIDEIVSWHGSPGKIVYVPSVGVGPSGDGVKSATTLDLEAIRDYVATKGVRTFDPVPLINAIASGTAQDLLDISAGVVCASLLQDGVHLTQAAMDTIATQVTSLLSTHGI